jgi:hypothetical protein
MACPAMACPAILGSRFQGRGFRDFSLKFRVTVSVTSGGSGGRVSYQHFFLRYLEEGTPHCVFYTEGENPVKPFLTQAGGSRCWTNPIVCYRNNFALELNPHRFTLFDRNAAPLFSTLERRCTITLSLGEALWSKFKLETPHIVWGLGVGG